MANKQWTRAELRAKIDEHAANGVFNARAVQTILQRREAGPHSPAHHHRDRRDVVHRASGVEVRGALMAIMLTDIRCGCGGLCDSGERCPMRTNVQACDCGHTAVIHAAGQPGCARRSTRYRP